MGVSKVIYGGKTLIDISQDTVTPSTLLKGNTAHGANGELIEGACEFDVDSSEATANPAEVLKDKTFAKGGTIHTGTMPNNGAKTLEISKKDDAISIAQGYHDGGGKAKLADSEKSKLIPSNIREGITILGVEGEMSGSEDMKAQNKEVTPSSSQQVVTPDSGYNALAQVTVKAIPYVESDNSAGGKTVTIG